MMMRIRFNIISGRLYTFTTKFKSINTDLDAEGDLDILELKRIEVTNKTVDRTYACKPADEARRAVIYRRVEDPSTPPDELSRAMHAKFVHEDGSGKRKIVACWANKQSSAAREL